jgi:hypothetical protein
MARVDEGRDLERVKQLVFTPRGLILKPFTQTQLLTGRTPDFKVFKRDQHAAYCEVKSPRDDWLNDQIEAAPPEQLLVDCERTRHLTVLPGIFRKRVCSSKRLTQIGNFPPYL